MIIFISVLNTIVTEKEAKLKDSLVMMGLKVEVYWLSCFISNAWLMIICSLITCLGGLAFGFFAFKNSNFFVLFITFLLFGLAMIAFGFFITTFCRRSQVAVLVGYFLFITGLLFESSVLSDDFVGYIWRDDGKNKVIRLVLIDDKFLPAPIQSWYLLLMNIAFYAILTWYFDKVIPDEYGVEVDSDEDEDVANERNLAFNPEHDAALQSNCLALLGQNGAGKSTTINIISCAARATSGDALLYGCSVKDEIGKIRTMMGVCPQHDILFNDLTAREHIELYAGIKNIPAEEIQKLVDERLASVRLAKVADKLAGEFSGGMKRRLSTIIATIGDPKILFLDEPTTGLDPVNRRHVWSFIENFKRGRVIILTTHSMEEADVLGDRICVMAHGSLRALGNSIRLKRKFGSGYRVSLVTRVEDSARLKRLMEKRIPEAILEDDSAGSLLYELPNSALPKLPTLINWFEENEEKSYVEPTRNCLKLGELVKSL
ncbi:4076_t:CDS:2 [Funneliformis caledonium]|uniref:4076_t:CDS:1 n=1 Tax=Funneliformis caledonium TaxID=1117310 RepID=A0A9N9CRX6_9GLOM|nr:4076_t:CDS:2 [Funneliformis caledonium]